MNRWILNVIIIPIYYILCIPSDIYYVSRPMLRFKIKNIRIRCDMKIKGEKMLRFVTPF